jgi:hypothetical protein
VPWALGLAGLAVAAAITVAAGTRPSFDAYGWLDWGRMTLHGGLDTNAAPSWKPLPYLFTLVYGRFGADAQLWLWMITVTAISLAGLVWAARLAARCSGAGPSRRWTGWVAALVAVAALLGVHDEYGYGYLHYVLSAQTDPMIVAFLLGAVDCQLRGRPRAAFGLVVLAALGRPEAWPVLAVDGWWLWRAQPRWRWAILAAVGGVGLLWFGIPALTSRSWFISGDNADASGMAPMGNRALGVLGRFSIQTPWPLQVAAGIALVIAVWRRQRVVLGLAAAAVVWMAIELAFGLHGWPALGRYMFEPAAVEIVLGAGLVGRLLGGGVSGGRESVGGGASGGGRRVRGGRAAAGWVLAALIVGGSLPALVTRERAERRDLSTQQVRTTQLEALVTTIDRLGGAGRLRRCGEVISAGPGRSQDGLETQTALAYDVGENVNRVGYTFPQPGHPSNPIIVFRPRGGGWSVRALRQTEPGCRSLERP